jgi:hypothetical protein
MRLGKRSGFLLCAAHGEAVSSFGRNDGFYGWEKRGNGNSNCKTNCNDRSRSLREDNKKATAKAKYRFSLLGCSR